MREEKNLCELIADATIEQAYQWLCKKRAHYPANADIWDLRHHWHRVRKDVINQLVTNTYRFRPLQIIKKRDGNTLALWGAQDALVIKMLAITLEATLPMHRRCEHIKGNGGGKAAALRAEREIVNNNRHYVCRTDIKGYYASIDKSILLNQLNAFVHCPILHDLLYQFLHYTVEDGGTFHTPVKGISRGSSLSPLLGAFHLYVVDAYFAEQPNLYYSRYMDDFLIITTTRWHLRKAIKKLNQFFNQFSFVQHPDKTVIGKIDNGFDWMGFQFSRQGIVAIAPRSMDKLIIKLAQLYEQNLPLRAIERALTYFHLPHRALASEVALSYFSPIGSTLLKILNQ